MQLGVQAGPFLVSPNQGEAEQLVGQELEDDADFLMALDAIAEMGARNVVITLENGCFALLRLGRKTSGCAPSRRGSSRCPAWAPATSCSPSSSPRSSRSDPRTTRFASPLPRAQRRCARSAPAASIPSSPRSSRRRSSSPSSSLLRS